MAAKAQAKKKKTTKDEKTPVDKQHRNDRIRMITALLIFGFTAVLLIAQISYLFSWKRDQSILDVVTWSSTKLQTENGGGRFGVFLGVLTLDKWFGLPSLAIPFLLLLTGLRTIRVYIMPYWRTMWKTIGTMALVSVWLGFIFLHSNQFLGSGPGGRHGYYLASHFRNLFGVLGTLVVLLIVTGIFLMLANKKIFILFKNKMMPGSLLGQYDADAPAQAKNKTDKFQDDEELNVESIDYKDDLVFETEFPQKEDDRIRSTPEPFIRDDIEVEPRLQEETVEVDEVEDIDFSVENPNYHEETSITSGHLEMDDYDPTLDLPHFQLPSLNLLEEYESENINVTNEELIGNKNKIEETLKQFNISITKIKATIGPTVTLYEIVPAPGIRISKIKNLEDDIALNLSALGIRIIAPIPGKGTIGIEVPNQQPEVVSLRSLLTSKKFQESKFELAIALGKTISNETYVFNLAKMPHLLVAGATGQGKSVGLNVIIASLLYRKHPSQLKFVLVDPKKVELTLYSRLEKHYLAQLPDDEEAIVTDTQKVINTLNSLCMEMDTRYDLLKAAQVRNINEYNEKFTKRRLNPEKGHRYLPYIVVVIDEFADLIMTAGREVETPLARLAQLARAIGIHLVIATQRPTTNIITGMIKANFPARIAFRVTSMMDSRTILDSPGANQLIGRGDLLFAPGSDIIRLQCAFIDIPELDRITEFISSQKAYPTPFYLPEYSGDSNSDMPGDVDLSKKDTLFNDAARLIVAHQQGSTSLIQRKFSIGYNRAGRIMDQLEAAGICGPSEGSKARQVLFPDEYSLEQFLNSLEN